MMGKRKARNACPIGVRQILAVQQLCGLKDIQFEKTIIPLHLDDIGRCSGKNVLHGE
jgi:hypothetical protein